MTEGTEGRHRHFILEGVTETEAYSSLRQRVKRPQVPEQDRAQHGGELQRQINELREEADSVREVQRDAGIEDGLGLQVEFESFPDVELAFESLARERSGIELLNVRHEGNRTLATVFVPDGKLNHFERLIRDYLAERKDSIGRARDNRRLIDAIQQIRAASLRALWTDTETFPSAEEGPALVGSLAARSPGSESNDHGFSCASRGTKYTDAVHPPGSESNDLNVSRASRGTGDADGTGGGELP